MTRNLIKLIAIFVIGMVGGIFADQIFWPYFVERPLFSEYRLEQNPVYVTDVKEITVQENTALKDAVGKVEKVVVGVKTETVEGEILEGSGLIVTSDGLIVTLAELVPQGSGFTFFVEGKKASYQILKRDLEENLALIKLEKENLPTVSFADLGKLKPGERVFLIGQILIEVSPQSVVNEGIVKNFDEDYLYTNISESRLMAGSPLFNIKGEALGLNTIDAEGKIATIPINIIKTFIGM
jgi:serine protease Do